MPPKKPEKATERVLTRQVTQDQGITLEWQPFGHGGGIDVSEVVDGQTRETAPDTEIEGQANGIELPERNEDLEWDHTPDTLTPLKRTSDAENLSEVDHSSEEEPEVQTSNLENPNPQKTWSTGVNRFDQYSTGDNSLTRLREGNFRSTVRSNLETVVGSESDLLSNSDVFEEDANDDETSQEHLEQPENQIEVNVIFDHEKYLWSLLVAKTHF